MERIYVSSTSTQTEQLTSPILWHCLHAVKSIPDFRGLSHRVTTDMNGNEILIINRDQVTRVFGPPVEPITLTIDPAGKCLLSIPFRPVQHVPITKSKGHLELTSLHALLHMVAGKGFCFCPGIPAKFLAGRACGKFVVMHRSPFKRYNAGGCPIYFKLPKSMNSNKGGPLPIRTLCPRCRQVAKWAQAQPVSQNTTRPSAVNPYPQNQVLYPAPADKSGNNSDPAKNGNVLAANTSKIQSEKTLPNNNPVTSSVGQGGGVSATGVLPLTVLDSSKSYSSNNHDSASNISEARKKAPGGAVSNSSNAAIKKRAGMNSEKLQAVSDSLRQLLRQRSMTREGVVDGAARYKVDGAGQNRVGEKSPGSSRPRSPRSEKLRKNVCRICHKQFSSNLKLSKHVQRHEGNTPHLSQVLRRKLRRRKTSAVVLNRLVRGFSSQSSNAKGRNSFVSEWSLQLMLNSLDGLLSNEKKPKVDAGKVNKVASEKKRSRSKRKMESIPLQLDNLPIRPGLHRSGSGLDAVQTLLNAAQLADDDDAKASNIGNTNNFSVQNGLMPELSIADPAMKRDSDSPSNAKKARQSVRLASKRAGKKTKHATNSAEASGGKDRLSQGNNSADSPGHPSDEALTNLNLLSTVSLQAELRDNRGSPGLQLLSYAGNLDSTMNNSSSKSMKQSTFSRPPSADSSQKNGLDQRAVTYHQIPTTVVSNRDDYRPSKNNNLPPIPPLILSTDSLLMNHSAHSSATSSPSVPLPPSALSALPGSLQLHNNVAKGHDNAMASNVNLLPREDVLGSNCGAMDLSKPKSLQYEAHPSSSQISPAPQNSAEVLRQLMMINKPQKPIVVQPEPIHDPRIRLLSSKEADDSLQARMFASAKNYKVDPSKLLATGHLPAAVAASQAPASTVPIKQPKVKEKLNLPAQLGDKSEIQCGYKWSGSGGLVKERTQLVRELVPSVVMANILNGPVSNSALPKMDDPISAPMQNITKSKGVDKQQQEFQKLVTKPPQPPVSMTSQNSPSTHITLKPREAPVRPKTPQYVLNLSKNRNDADVQPTLPHFHNKSAPFPASILKTSLLNTPSVLIPTSMFAQKPPIQNSIPGSALKKVHANTSVLAPLRNTVLATLPTPMIPTTQQIPNSSLATILRHPTKLMASNPSPKTPPEVSYSVTVSSAVVPISTASKSSTVVELTEIKTEPLESYDNTGKMTIPDALGDATVVKIEKPGSQHPASSGDRDLSTPPNLVVDMGGEKNAVPVSGKPSTGKTNNSNSSNGKSSSKGKVSIVNSPLKCEFCFQVFRTIRGHDYHVCVKRP